MPRGLWIAVFLAVLFGLLYGWHFFLYSSTLHFFGITARNARRALALLLILLPASFFLTAILSRRVDLGPFRSLVLLSHLWLGVGLALMLGYGLAWLAWGLSRWHNPRPSPVWYGATALLLAALYSVWGIWNATHPLLKEIRLELSGLPPSWSSRKIIQLTDVHLGPILGTGFLRRVVDAVNRHQPDVVVITGDLYDGEDHDLERFTGLLNDIQAPLGVYFVTGNHETYLGVRRALEALRKTQVRVLNDQMVVLDGLQIVGLSYPAAGFTREVRSSIEKIPGFDRGRPSILLYHSPTQLAEVRAAGIHLQLSGHTHRGQLFPLNFITRLIYGKEHYGLHQQEGFAVYTSCGTGTWGPLMRTSGRSEITLIHLASR